jgi:hypothetical protein
LTHHPEESRGRATDILPPPDIDREQQLESASLQVLAVEWGLPPTQEWAVFQRPAAEIFGRPDWSDFTYQLTGLPTGPDNDWPPRLDIHDPTSGEIRERLAAYRLRIFYRETDLFIERLSHPWPGVLTFGLLGMAADTQPATITAAWLGREILGAKIAKSGRKRITDLNSYQLTQARKAQKMLAKNPRLKWSDLADELRMIEFDDDATDSENNKPTIAAAWRIRRWVRRLEEIESDQ